MPRDQFGNVISGSYNEDGSINRKMMRRYAKQLRVPPNPSPDAASMLADNPSVVKLPNPGVDAAKISATAGVPGKRVAAMATNPSAGAAQMLKTPARPRGEPPATPPMTHDQMIAQFERDRRAGRVVEYVPGPVRDAYVKWASTLTA